MGLDALASSRRSWPPAFFGVASWAAIISVMAKRTNKQQNYSWSIYRLRATPAQLIGLVYDRPDEQTAIKPAIEGFNASGRVVTFSGSTDPGSTGD